jgi:hypothetical protein
MSLQGQGSTRNLFRLEKTRRLISINGINPAEKTWWQSQRLFLSLLLCCFLAHQIIKRKTKKKKRNGTSLWCGTVAVRFGARALVATLYSIAE